MFSDLYLFYSVIIFILLFAIPTYNFSKSSASPYGKHRRPSAGPTIPPPLAWFLMESPTLWVTLLLFPLGQNKQNPLSYLLISPFIIHYTNRTIIYPLKLLTHHESNNKYGFPVAIAATAFVYNLLNAYIQARWVSHYADLNSLSCCWPRLVFGFAVFAAGMAVNVWADGVLVGLKKMGGGYKVPRGGLYEYVSCPNYFGEMMEWLGWAIMQWSWPGFTFFVYTCANLVPRAVLSHKWYLEKFGEDYPRNRKAVVPFLY